MAYGDRQRIRITDKVGDKTIHIVEKAGITPGGALRLDFVYVGAYDNNSGYNGYYPDKKVNARIIAAGEWLEVEYLEDDASFWAEEPAK